MIRPTLPLVLVAFLLLCCGCDRLISKLDEASNYHGKLSKPQEAKISLENLSLASLDQSSREALFRHLAASERWEIRQQQGLKYAVRLRKQGEVYTPTLNGFYSDYRDGKVHQRRVLLSFGKPHGFGREHGNVTRAKAGDKSVAMVVEGDHSGTPGNSSYLIAQGGADVFLEVYEQGPNLARTFTSTVVQEVSEEVEEVLAHKELLLSKGVLPQGSKYHAKTSSTFHMKVKDGMQPGIYMVDASVHTAAPGQVYIKAFDQKGKALSEDRIRTASTRHLGWSSDPSVHFPYTSEVVVYEGDWDHQYNARFELWHRGQQGSETKLAEVTRMIHGWQH